MVVIISSVEFYKSASLFRLPFTTKFAILAILLIL